MAFMHKEENRKFPFSIDCFTRSSWDEKALAACDLIAACHLSNIRWRKVETALRQLPCCTLEGDLQELSVWAEENKVAFNASKSATLLVGGKSRRKFLQCLHVNNAPVPHKQSHRHHGVVLSESLRWDDHISAMCSS